MHDPTNQTPAAAQWVTEAAGVDFGSCAAPIIAGPLVRVVTMLSKLYLDGIRGQSVQHELKIPPHHYCRIADGSMTFVVYSSEKGFQPGDQVKVREFDPKHINPTDDAQKGFTDSPEIVFKVGYVFILDSRQVIFSLLPLPKKPRRTKKKTKNSKA